MTHSGTVVRWMDRGGYGFIKVEEPAGTDLKEVFAHRSEIKGLASSILVGTKVNFNVCTDGSKRRLKAIDIVLEDGQLIPTSAVIRQQPLPSDLGSKAGKDINYDKLADAIAKRFNPYSRVQEPLKEDKRPPSSSTKQTLGNADMVTLSNGLTLHLATYLSLSSDQQRQLHPESHFAQNGTRSSISNNDIAPGIDMATSISVPSTAR